MNELKEIGKAALVNAREAVEKNKELVEQAYHLIMHLEEVSHRYGLLALDEAIGYCPKDVPLCEEVTELINMVIHGMEAEYISELAYIKFEENEYRGIETLAMVLKRERAEVVDVFMRNLSVKLSYMIWEDIDCMGPVRMCDVEDTQRKIMQIVEKIRSDRSGEHAI